MAVCSIIIPVPSSTLADPSCLSALARLAPPAAGAVETILAVTGDADWRRRVSAPVLVFLDPDVEPRAGWLDALLRHAHEHPGAAAIGSKRLRIDGTVHDAGVAVGHDRWPRPLYAGFPGDHPLVNRTRRVAMVSGASLLVRRDAFDAADGFDPALGAAHADHDLCLRLGERGHEVHYCHASVVSQPARTAATPARARDIAAARLHFRLRWAHRLQPDDLTCYVDDGLLRWRYVEGQPLPVLSFPTVAGPSGTRDLEIYRRLIAEAQTVDGVTIAPGDPAAEVGPMPSQALQHRIGGAFGQVGQEFLQHFIELGGLKPSERVLDVGSGAGRLALPLTTYLDPAGRYEGFDVMADAVAWCQAHITSRFPHFRFQHIDVSNTCYNPSGGRSAASHRFPYADASFDFVYATSVFTHMLPDAVRHYLAQTAAVLAPGGRCFSTFFLLNAASEALIRTGASARSFAHRRAGVAVDNPAVPEDAVAYDEGAMRAIYRECGLAIEQIRYGSWSGRLDGLSFQDIVLAVKA